MTINDLIPGDIISWDGEPSVIEAIKINKPFYTMIKLNNRHTSHSIDGQTEVLYLGHQTSLLIIDEVCHEPRTN